MKQKVINHRGKSLSYKLYTKDRLSYLNIPVIKPRAKMHQKYDCATGVVYQ